MSDRELLRIVQAQAEDAGLWFVAQTAPEAYLQAELRKLHAAVESGACSCAGGVVVRISICRCPIHGFWSISVDGDSSGIRVTPSKCCGRWDEIHSWPLSESMCDEIIEEISAAKEHACAALTRKRR